MRYLTEGYKSRKEPNKNMQLNNTMNEMKMQQRASTVALIKQRETICEVKGTSFQMIQLEKNKE